jgi:hypothetical protein
MREADSECPAFNPSNRRFFDPQRPVQSGNMKTTFKLRPLHDPQIALNLAPAYGNVERPALPFLIRPRQSTAELGREPWLDTPLLRLAVGGGRNLRLEKGAQFL